MQGDVSGVGSDNFDWNTDDELEIEGFHSSCLSVPNGETIAGSVGVSFNAPFLLLEVIFMSS